MRLATTILALVVAGLCSQEVRASESGRADVEAALSQMAEADPGRRVAAIASLASKYPEGACGVPLLLNALRDENDAVRKQAATGLRTLGAAGIRDLTEFLRDATKPQNRAFDKARRYIVEAGARATPWSLAEIEGTDARSVRLCLTPIYEDPDTERSLRLLFLDVLSDDAGTYERAGHGLLPLESRRIACASLAVHGLRGLPAGATPPASNALLALARSKDESAAWGALRMLSILRPQSGQAAELLASLSVRERELDLGAVVAGLPDPEGRLSPLELLFLDYRLRRVFALGARAKPVTERLLALHKRVRARPPRNLEGQEYMLLSALARLDGGKSEYIEPILEGLEARLQDRSQAHPRAQFALRALAQCVHAVEGPELRARAVRGAWRVQPVVDMEYQPLVARIVEVLRDAATAALPVKLEVVLSEMEGALADFRAKVAKERASGAGRLGRFQLWLASPRFYGPAHETRVTVARLLADLHGVSEKQRKRLLVLSRRVDIVMRCEIARAMR